MPTRPVRRIALVLSALVGALLACAAPATAACSRPGVPAVRATWTASGGPRISVTPTTGSLPVTVLWATATQDGSTWSAWSKWSSKSMRTRAAATTLAPRPGTAARVAVTALAKNACGQSKSAMLDLPLATAEQTRLARAVVATDLPRALGGVDVADLVDNPLRMPVTVSSSTAAVCTATATRITFVTAGECRLRFSERSNAVTTPNPDLDLVLQVLASATPAPASAQDRPDDVTGFQFHVVYVTLADSPGHDQYRTGLVDLWVQAAQRWLQRTIGRQLRMDSAQGALDVSVLQSSLTTAQLALSADESSGTQSLERLREEYLAANGATTLHGKNLVFLVDAPVSSQYCGWADTPGSLALVLTTGEGCWTGLPDFLGAGRGLNWVSVTLLHEITHNMGVHHTCFDATDLMLGGACTTPRALAAVTLDAPGGNYRGGSTAGADILSEQVWSDGSGTRHLPQPGTCYVGQSCALPVEYWSSGVQQLELQQYVNGSWQTLASFSAHGGGADPGYPYTYDVRWTPSTTGTVTFRYRLPASGPYGEYVEAPFTIEVPY